MPSHDRLIQRIATVEKRVEAIQTALDARGMNATGAVKELGHLAQKSGIQRMEHASWRKPGSIRRFASACSPMGAWPLPRSVSRCQSITDTSSSWKTPPPSKT